MADVGTGHGAGENVVTSWRNGARVVERRFDRKVAVVTGAGSGLGRSHATELARRGATVIINDVRTDGAEDSADGSTAAEVAAELQSLGWQAEADAGDLTDESYATGMIERVIERHGRLDVLINNAGMTAPGSIFDTTTQSLQRIFAVNYWSAFWTMRAAIPVMRERGYGRVVNTSSGVGAFGAANRVGYVSSKAAVIGLTKAGALDTDDTTVRVNAICPIAYTPMSRVTLAASTDADRDTLDVRRVTPVVLFLAHKDCELNGEVLSAGMGRWARIFTAKTRGVETASMDVDDVFGELDAILDTSDFRILRAARDQFRGSDGSC